ncbi:potassium transporter family protein [Actinidia rufa]|uniref:Potassium transporter n=1 Tax=Actinidia rufa TaxID=165716 RepID=A0A7J0E9D1_9ERIC|nr:potassium transporter family protein [Actinidia rufa]
MGDSKIFSLMEEEDPENGGTGTNNDDLERDKDEHTDVVDRTLSFSKIYQPPLNKAKTYNAMQTLLLAYQSLGVVYGDLGTSPVNVLSSIRLSNPTEEDLLGILSLIVWTLTLLVLVKYVFIVLHADDHGEGGTFALYSYLCRHINFSSKFTIRNTRLEADDSMRFYNSSRGSALQSKTKKFLESSSKAQSLLTFVALLGTCMVIGDGALTPATCVLSALQGIQSRSSKITQGQVVFMAVVLLVALFAFQRCGTSKVGFSFSPIMVMWFVSNVSIGIYNIFRYHPRVVKGLSPHYIYKFFARNGKTGWDLLGAIFLSITGAEAMFADLGHFNKRAIQLAFSLFVYPSLVLTYAGEAAYLVKNPEKLSDAYYSSIPDQVYWPMFVISTLSAVVSSQSMISASFSIVKQSLALGCFPRVNMIHTSSKHEGQVYSPEINYILMILCVALVVGFKGGVELSNAYGVVVIWVMIITTFLTTLVMLVIWDTNFLLICVFFFPCILIEGIFMTSLLNKIPQGGWVPFAISAFFLVIMLSWTYGRSKKSMYEAEKKMSIGELNLMISRADVYRPPGICFFCTDLVNGIPPIIRRYIEHTNSVREIMVVVTVRTLPIKTVLPEERLVVGKLGLEGVYRCLVQFGYKDPLSMEGDDYMASVVEKLHELAETTGERQQLESAAEKGAVFVIGRTILKSNKEKGWFARFTIDHLYRFLQKNSCAAISTLQVPPENTLQVGMLYEI